MDKKSKILLVVLIFGVIVSIGITYYMTIIKTNFDLVNITSEDNTDNISNSN